MEVGFNYQTNINQCIAAAAQNMLLNDPDEIKRTLEHNRAMERDAHKAMLKMQVDDHRALFRSKVIEMFEIGQKIWIQEANLNGQIIRKIPVFDCQLNEVGRYIRETGEEQFQLVILAGGSKVYSSLYDVEYLKSPKKLQQTMLCKYNSMQEPSIMAIAWDWMWRRAVTLYEGAKTISLPSLPGWYGVEGNYVFWARNRSNEVYQNEAIGAFELRYIQEQREIVKKALMEADRGSIGEAGGLLIIRLAALIGRLCTEELPASGLVLYGDLALATARGLLSVSASDNNIINLDTDRINVIRTKVKLIRDDVVIFSLSNLESKSTQNRIKEVTSWFESGYMEGDRVIIPYIFCVKKLPVNSFGESFIYINTDSISVSYWKLVFDALQSYWVDAVEKGGSYIVENLQQILKQQENKGAKGIVCLSNCIIQATCSYVWNEETGILREILEAGGKMFRSQSQIGQDYLVDVFQDTVRKMGQKRLLKFCRYTGDTFYNEKVVYFDDGYYYFTNEVMTSLCEAANISSNSMMLLKQQLILLNYVKLYRTTGNRRELQVDIGLKNKSGIRKHYSAFAVKRCFWDEIGGVCLFERGEILDA